MARLIGTELIERAEVNNLIMRISIQELKNNFNSLYEIWCEMEDNNE